jgi:hypothetical protein
MLATNSDNPPSLATESADHFLVRLGTMGHVGRFRLTEILRLRRGERVVCRSTRGIEVGVVLGPTAAGGHLQADMSDGGILRRMSAEDEMLWGHLRELGSAAHKTCEAWLAAQGIIATLLDVEPLLDGRTLYFHFLSDVGPEIQDQLDRLVSIYEEEVRRSEFSRLLEHGCGPGCGTENATNGCGSKAGCAVCVAKSRCATNKK